MQLPGSPSWTIQVNPWPESFDLALWFRAAEVRPIGSGRHLVPERLYVGPRWPEVLRALLIPYA